MLEEGRIAIENSEVMSVPSSCKQWALYTEETDEVKEVLPLTAMHLFDPQRTGLVD